MAPSVRFVAIPTLCLALAIISLCALPSRAQRLTPDDRPGDERLETLLPAERGPVEEPILPPVPMPRVAPRDPATGETPIRIDEVRIVGNTVLPERDIRRIVEAYVGRVLSLSQILELRDRLTLAYVDRGYLTSGAILPLQDSSDGVLTIEVVEGRIREVVVENESGRFRDRYFRRRIESMMSDPLNVSELEARLRTFQRDPRIRRIDARLAPTVDRGSAILHLKVDEAPPVSAGVDVSNHRNPSIGPYGSRLRVTLANPLGVGDALRLRGTFTEGLWQAEGRYTIPLNRWDTTFTLRYRESVADVIADPIASVIDIESVSRTMGAELRHPIFRSETTILEAFVRGELRRSKSRLFGEGFSFTIDPTERGVSKVTAIRWGVDWGRRSRTQAVSLRSLLSIGIDALDSTRSRRPFPDGRFVAWLGQGQWLRRVPLFDGLILTRIDLQLTGDALLPMEQFAIGGRATVRGYRENQMVRDNGVVGSLEVRVPIYERVSPRVRVELAPFFDVGHSWNSERGEVGDQTLASVGLGLRARVTKWSTTEIYWGRGLRDVTRVGERDLQDNGVHFRASFGWR